MVFESTLGLRSQLRSLPPGETRREPIRQYLQMLSQLTDLSGRMHYLLRDAVERAAYDVAADAEADADFILHELRDIQVSKDLEIEVREKNKSPTKTQMSILSGLNVERSAAPR